MATFNLRCPKNYPRRCNLLETEKEQLERAEKYTAFLMYQFSEQDDYLVDTIKRFFQSPTYHIFDAREEVGLGIKICKICRLAQASDFGLVILTPENLNVYLEAGMMMGMGKRNLYMASRNILKAQNKTLKDIAFDLSDQLVIEHGNPGELLKKLEKEVPPFIENVIVDTASEREQRKYWRSIYERLSPNQKTLLRFLLLAKKWRHTGKLWSWFYSYRTSLAQPIDFIQVDFNNIYREILEDGRIIVRVATEIGLGQSDKIYWGIDPLAQPYLEELVFEEE